MAPPRLSVRVGRWVSATSTVLEPSLLKGDTMQHVANRGVTTYRINVHTPMGDTLEIFGGDGSIKRAWLAPMLQERAEVVGIESQGDSWREIDDRLTISMTGPELIFDGMGYLVEWRAS